MYFELSGASDAANDVDDEPNPPPPFVDDNLESVLVKRLVVAAAVDEEFSPFDDTCLKLLKSVPFGLNCPNKRVGVDVLTLLNNEDELSVSDFSSFVWIISAKIKIIY